MGTRVELLEHAPDPHGFALFLESWIRICIRIGLKSRIQIRIKVKIKKLGRLKIEQWRAVEAWSLKIDPD
jgi:hypothetical protein